MRIKPEIISTEDGSSSLVHPIIGETYHSMHGAETEAIHVFISNGFRYVLENNLRQEKLRVLEAGFGSGLNAWLTMREAGEMGVSVDYTGIELYPVELSVIKDTSYAAYTGFSELHQSAWNTATAITPQFTLTKLDTDLSFLNIDTTFDLVYFDMFSPDVRPELWSTEVFSLIYERMRDYGVLVTYSAKGDVKRALRAAGFEVSRLPGAPGKRHMLRAVKK